MSIKEVVLIGIAMAMDAFGLSISLGINPILKRKNKIGFILSFAFFQFLFIFIGGLVGVVFNTYIASIPNLVAGGVIGVIGIIMIIEGFKNEDRDDTFLIKKCMYIILGMSVSIDALVVGFTAFHHITSGIVLVLDSIIVGLITLLMCLIGFYMCRYIRRIGFISKYSGFFGGIILMIFAIKMIFF